MQQLLEKQRAYFLTGATLPVSGRVQALKCLRSVIYANQNAIYEALKSDLGKSEAECGNYVNLEVSLANAQCAFYRDVIRDWTEADLSYEK